MDLGVANLPGSNFVFDELDVKNMSLVTQCDEVEMDGSQIDVHDISVHPGPSKSPESTGSSSEPTVSEESTSTPLAASLSVNTADNEAHFMCTICDITFTVKSSLLRHNKKHDGSMLPCSVPGCDRKFYDSYDLKRHIQANHQGIELECEHCSKTFKTKSGLERHSQSHNDTYKYTCDLCGRGFAYSQHFTDHINIHYDIKPHICSLCQASFIRKRDYDFHMTICGKDAQVECEVCGKKFKSKKYLVDHKHTHTSPKFQCSKCGNQYSHRGSLKNHESRKHNM